MTKFSKRWSDPALVETCDVMDRLFQPMTAADGIAFSIGSPAQEAYLRLNPVSFTYPDTHYEAATRALDAAGLNPEGERYGSKWWREDVPEDVLVWLAALPDADRKPAWV